MHTELNMAPSKPSLVLQIHIQKAVLQNAIKLSQNPRQRLHSTFHVIVLILKVELYIYVKHDDLRNNLCEQTINIRTYQGPWPY